MFLLTVFLLGATIASAQVPGERIFQSQCAHCHGPRGEGGRGANLARPRLRHAADDQALFRVIDEGIEGTEMPGAGMSTQETLQVVAYVRSLGRVASTTVSGDAVRGGQVYTRNGCASCHTIQGRGGALGPDLTDAGERRSPAHLRASVIEPEAEVPDGFLQVRVTPRSGSVIAGVRVNEDSFSIQVRDLSGRLHSFWKADLMELVREPGKSPMPSYREKLSATDLDDLVAYLVALEGAP